MLTTQKSTEKKRVGSLSRTVWLVYMALLIAMIVVLTCLPIKTMGLEITLALMPISVGAVLLGPVSGLILGGVYGFCSFLQCLGLLLPSPFGAALLTINPPFGTIFAIITCVVPRLICGFVPALVFRGLKKIDKTKVIAQIVACMTCPLLNTALFMTCLMVFYGNSDLIQGFMETLGIFNPFLFVFAFVGINGLVEILTCSILSPAIVKALEQVNKHL